MKPEKTIDFHLRWLWQKIMRIYNQEAAKFGGTMSVGYALLNIDKDGTPSTKLGPKMGMESRSLTRTLKSMEDNGLIYKTQDETDGRLVLLHLTEEGKKYRDTSREVVLKLNEHIYNNVDPQKLEVFFEVSQQINELLNSSSIYELKPELSPNR
jgi:DNA-binding MarR family transcriptional regulator